MVGSSSSPTSGKANRREYCKWDIALEELCLSYHYSCLEQRGEREILCPWSPSAGLEHLVQPEAPVKQLPRAGQDHCVTAHPLCCW